METLKLTPIDQIEDLADGVPVLAVEGTVKYAQELKRSQADAAHAWTKQFFVLSSGTAEIACSMWDAEGSELAKGEKVHIENTQNKKGQWNGMTKGSYQKDGERKHTLEIRCNQVKITSGKSDNATSSGNPAEYRDGSADWLEQPPVKHETGYTTAASFNPPKHSTLDERQRAIIRQHSQSMALEVLKLKVALNELTIADLTPSKLKSLADYFDEDVLGAAV